MTYAFGDTVRFLGQAPKVEISAFTPAEDMMRVRRTLTELGPGSTASLRFYRPLPTAAFSPRDTSHPAHEAVIELLRARGFAPSERGAGGQLAVYDQSALVIDLVAPHPEPRENTRDRYRLFSGLIASAFAAAGVDARVGEIAGEYCPGDYSVNAEGRIKLAGLAQRIGKQGYHMGAVLSIGHSEAARAAVAEAYAMMSIPFESATFGSMADLVPVPSIEDACNAIATTITAGLREATAT